MREYYTRACNFYHGKIAKNLILNKKALPLNSRKDIAFDQIEIFQRKKNKIVESKFCSITEIKSLDKKILPEIEKYTIEKFIPAISKGSSLSDSEKNDVAVIASRYSGLSAKDYLDHNLDVPTSYFWKKLLYEDGLTIGRLDSRYKGIDKTDAGIRYDHDPAMAAWNHSFTPAMNHYLKEELNRKQVLLNQLNKIL